MIRRALTLALALAAVAPTVAVAKEPPPAHAGRRVPIKVTDKGYEPAQLTAKPGEKLVLVFLATDAMGCCDAIIVPQVNASGTVTKDKPLEIPVTMPASGKLVFACSMTMCRGEISPAK